MAENSIPQPQSNDEPETGPIKTGYDALGEDGPTPAGDDEPVTGPVKTGYDVESE